MRVLYRNRMLTIRPTINDRVNFIGKIRMLKYLGQGLLLAADGHLSDKWLCIICVPGYLRSEYWLRPTVTFQIDLLVIQGFPKFRFQNIFDDKMERRRCNNKKCKCSVQCNESPEIFGGGDVIHNHDAESEACLNRQILNNSVKRNGIGDLSERPPN